MSEARPLWRRLMTGLSCLARLSLVGVMLGWIIHDTGVSSVWGARMYGLSLLCLFAVVVAYALIGILNWRAVAGTRFFSDAHVGRARQLILLGVLSVFAVITWLNVAAPKLNLIPPRPPVILSTWLPLVALLAGMIVMFRGVYLYLKNFRGHWRNVRDLMRR